MMNVKKIIINENATIGQALKVISEGAIRIAIVVNNNQKLIGTITDGDIRRGFLKKLNLNSSIKKIVFKKPVIAKKNDTKEKLLKIALSKKIYQIPIVDNNFKVTGIYLFNIFEKKQKISNKVVIMAGGKGMRLRPLTKNIPKPMLKLGEKPILQTIIEKFKKSGFENFLLCVNYKSNIIKKYFGNGENFGVNINYIHEKVPMGTAGALSLIKKKINEPFFVINGDLLTAIDFKKMLDFHLKNKSKATMAVREHNVNVPYGVVKINNFNVLSIDEKPKINLFVSAGINILDPSCVKYVPKRTYIDMPALFKKIINKKNKVICFPMQENWIDIGIMTDYKRAQSEFLNYEKY